jgi:hypothetical protein
MNYDAERPVLVLFLNALGRKQNPPTPHHSKIYMDCSFSIVMSKLRHRQYKEAGEPNSFDPLPLVMPANSRAKCLPFMSTVTEMVQ